MSKVTAAFAKVNTALFAILVAAMAVTIVLSNIGATKGVAFDFGFTQVITDGGFFLFPLAYILGDVISEVYGMRGAKIATFTSFAASGLAAICFWLLIALPAADWYDGQDALARTLGPVWLIVIASLLGFVAGQLLNAWVLVRLKARLGEEHLVSRLIGSTVVGVAVDTVIFCSIAASVIGITTAGDFINYLVVGIVYKIAVEIAVVPLTVLAIKAVKRREPSYQAEVTAGQ